MTGTHVFGGKTIAEVCAHHLHSIPDPPATRLGRAVDPDLEAVLLACLAKRPEARPASAQALREQLRACRAAGLWTNARAAEWWSKKGGALRSREAGTRAATDERAPQLTVTRVAE